MLFKKLVNCNIFRSITLNKYVILFFILIFGHAAFLLHGSVLCADDLCFSFLYGGIRLFKTFYYGTWVMNIINLFFYYIPYKLGVNIQDWCAGAGSIIKSSVITLIFIYFYKFLKAAKLKNTFSLSITALLYCLFYILQTKILYIDLTVTQGFFRFILPACIYEIFLYYCLKLYEGQSKNVLLLAVLAMFTAFSSEFVCLLALATVIMFSVSNKRNGAKWLKISSGVIAGILCLIFSKGFQLNIDAKLSNYSFSFGQIAAYIPSFCKLFFNKIIIGYLPFHLIMILASALVFKKHSDNINYIKFSFSVIFALFISLFALILLGKTSYENDFWLSHRDLYSIVDIVVYTVFVINICAISEIISKVETRKYLSVWLIIMCIIASPFLNSCSVLKSGLANIRDLSYMRDKMRLFYIYKGIPAKLPQFAKFLMPYGCITDKKVSPFDNREILSIDMEKDIIELMNKDYYPVLYKIDTNIINPDIKYAKDNTEAIEYYEQNGGSYAEREKKKYKFSNLSNKEYVLNEM